MAPSIRSRTFSFSSSMKEKRLPKEIISPVTLKEQSYIAAGSTVTGDVPKGALYVAREKGRIIEGWVERKGILKRKRKEE